VREAGLTSAEDHVSDNWLRLVVPPTLESERVDRALALLAGISRADASRVVAEGRARVGGVPVKTGSRRLRGGELLEAALPDAVAVSPGPATNEAPAPISGSPNAGSGSPEATVVFVDEDLLVVDKPAGLVVHPGAGNREGTLVQQLLTAFPDIAGAGPPGDRPGIVQRLDKGTSGLLVVARTPGARQALTAQLGARSMERRYLAVVHGEVEADEGLVDAPLGRSPSERVKMAVVVGGRPARTRYWAQARSASPLPVTLVSCQLDTGRTHQVRAHLAAIGHPVLADDRYSKPGQLALARATLPALRRPWLHANRLGFVHPRTGEMMSFGSEPPADLIGVLDALGLANGT
jgi:23S rRNA pseudouridine1911/1915/1917 synthase